MTTRNVLVVGASRGTGREVVRSLLAAGHRVTAFGRTASGGLGDLASDRLSIVDGDVLDRGAVGKAMVGQDAVVVTLGISDNPMKVRLLRRAGTAMDVRSRGTAVVIDAMREQGVHRLIVQTTYGLGDTWSRLSLQWKLTFRLLIGPQFTDSAQQEKRVFASGLDWTIVRPVSFTDDEPAEPARVSTTGEISGFTVARTQVARVIADAVATDSRNGQILCVSS